LIGLLAVVVGISGWETQVAALSDWPPNREETNCHVGTSSLDGFEINWTPLDNVVIVATVLTESCPRCLRRRLVRAVQNRPPYISASALPARFRPARVLLA
jgi:hypothetical protein